MHIVFLHSSVIFDIYIHIGNSAYFFLFFLLKHPPDAANIFELVKHFRDN